MIQVSDRFRAVAKRVLTELVFAHLKESCGRDDRRCVALVESLRDLVPAVEAKDTNALARAVGRFITSYTFYVGLNASGFNLPLEKLTSDAACRNEAEGIGRALVSCIPELYLGQSSACSAASLKTLVQKCGAKEPLIEAVKQSAEASKWDLATGPRNPSEWILLAIEVDHALAKRRLSSPWVNFVLANLRALTDTSRSYFDQGMAVHDNVIDRLAALTGARDTSLFPVKGSAPDNAVAACAPELVPVLAQWVAGRSTFAQAVRERTAPSPEIRAVLTRLAGATARPGCGERAQEIGWLSGAAWEALHMLEGIDAYRAIAEGAPLVGLILDLVNNRDIERIRRDALRWLVVASYDRLIPPLEPPTCEAAAARLLGGDVVKIGGRACKVAELGKLLQGKRLDADKKGSKASDLLADIGGDQVVLDDPSGIDLPAAAQLLLRLARAQEIAAPETVLEPLLLAARGDNEGAAARVLSIGGAKLLEAVRDQLARDRGKVPEHYRVIELVVEAAYAPLTEIFAGGDQQVVLANLADKALKHVYDDEALNRTPLLVRVGLGATVSHYSGESNQWALTLLDQFGVAYKWGGTKELYVGAFAGGFIDALVRTQQDGATRNFWVLGATAGITRFSELVPLGLEIHGGAALPFSDITNAPRGWMAGAALLVPIDLVFDD